MNSVSRRAFLSGLPLGLAAQTKRLPKKAKPLPAGGEFVRFIDAATENPVVRLTALGSNSVLPAARNRFISAREGFLVFSSDRAGRFAPFVIDLRSGAIRQLAEAGKLDPQSLCLDAQEKALRYLDDGALFEVALVKGTPRKLMDGVAQFAAARNGVVFYLSQGKLARLDGRQAAVSVGDVTDLQPQPNAAGCLLSRKTGPDEQEFLYALSGAKPGPVASGRVRQAYWDQDGQSVLFLRDVTAPNGTLLAEIHSKPVRGGAEAVVSTTSQFAAFAPNSDASVFVGASRSRAQPHVMLTLRSPHRELTLCEHRATHPGEVNPVFSPDNRRIYFQSDREGHLAIYAVNTEKLVEPPEE